MDKMIERAARFYAMSPTGQYDDMAELALQYVGEVLAGNTDHADEILAVFQAMTNDD